jgi:hypothetical protein
MLIRTLKAAFAALVLVSLSSCYGSSTSGLYLYITDAPIDLASAVNVSFSRVRLTGDAGTQPVTLTISPAANVDLYQLQAGIAALVTAGLALTPGHYTNLSITIAADPNTAQSNITLPDGVHILYLPNGVSPTVNMPIDFSIGGGGTVTLTVDFDLRKSIIQDPNDPTKYQLIPSMRAVQNELSGTLTGSIATSLITCLSPAVYVYPGKITPVDVDISAPASRLQPISTALVGYNQTSGLYNFTAAFLPPGTYTAAFTCEASQDVANQANTISFPAVVTADVQAGSNTFVALQ